MSEEKKVTFLERCIETISPAWAYTRFRFRAGLATLRSYDAGRIDRTNSDWVPVNASPEQTDAHHRDFVKARARDLERNSDIAEAILSAFIRNVVGTGIWPQPQIKLKNGKFDEKLNVWLEEAFKKWANPENCDIMGHSSYPELQEIVLGRRIIDGEIFARPVMMSDKSLFLPLQLQLLESDLLATELLNAPTSNNYIISGVEVNEYSKPLAYWFKKVSPDGFVTFDAYRVPAGDIMHLFRKRRPLQLRGFSEFARIINRMKETGRYLDAELLCREIAACFAVFVKTDMPAEQMQTLRTENKTNAKVKDIVPGTQTYLAPGESLETAQPPANGASVKDYTEVELRLAGAGVGLSYEEVSRDMSRSTYSSARQGHLADRKTYIPLQQYIITHFCRPVWKEFVKACVLSGKVAIPDFFTNMDRYLACNWIAPGWTWIDPLKDVTASKQEIRAGLTTVAETCAEQGKHWKDVFDQSAREKQYAQQLGLDLDIYQPQTTKGVGSNAATEPGSAVGQ